MFGLSPVSWTRWDVVRVPVWNEDVMALDDVPNSTLEVAGSFVVHETSAAVPPVAAAVAPEMAGTVESTL